MAEKIIGTVFGYALGWLIMIGVFYLTWNILINIIVKVPHLTFWQLGAASALYFIFIAIPKRIKNYNKKMEQKNAN